MERHYSTCCWDGQSWLGEIEHEDYATRKVDLEKEIRDETKIANIPVPDDPSDRVC